MVIEGKVKGALLAFKRASFTMQKSIYCFLLYEFL